MFSLKNLLFGKKESELPSPEFSPEDILEELSTTFVDLKNPEIPRNTSLEKKITKVCFLELALRQKYQDQSECDLLKEQSGILEDGLEYQFIDGNLFLGVNKITRQKLTLGNVFNIKGFNNGFYLRWIYTLKELNNWGIDEAIAELEKNISSIPTLHLKPSPPTVIDEVFYSSDNKYKILLPMFTDLREGFCCFFPKFDLLTYLFKEGFKYPLKNVTWLDRPLKVNKFPVILTDSIELAENNHISIFENKNHENQKVDWMSWYGEQQFIDDYNWSYLQNRNVYYLLYPHVDLSKEEIMNTAIAARKKLEMENVGSFSYICSYREDESLRSPLQFQILSSEIDDNAALSKWEELGK